jgi:hypothetical protein
MAVANSVFTDMPPGSYDAARPLIRNGDIALFAGQEGMSQLIEHATNSPFCHVGFIWRMDDIDRIMLLESVEVVGVRMVPLSGKINGGLSGKPYNGKMLVARHDDFPAPGPAFNAAFGAMIKVAVDRLGCPYNAEEIGLIAANIAAGIAHIQLPDFLKPTNAYICSEYADICYRALGIQIARARPDFIAPADFANDPKVKPVVTLAPD